jgi:hypothetical protein
MEVEALADGAIEEVIEWLKKKAVQRQRGRGRVVQEVKLQEAMSVEVVLCHWQNRPIDHSS